MNNRIAFIGVGAIGLPMAKRLLSHGEVTAVDPFPASQEKARGAGLNAIGSVSQLGQVDVAVVMVQNGAQVRSVLIDENLSDHISEDGSIIIMSTIGPKNFTDILADYHGAAPIIDAPVTGGIPGAESGNLKIFVAGDDTAIKSTLPLLEEMGSIVAAGPNCGDGQSFKMVNQLLATSQIVVSAEAIALAESLGLDTTTVIDGISGGSGSSWMFENFGRRMGEDELVDIAAQLQIFFKDGALVSEAAQAVGAFTPVLDGANRALAIAAEQNLGAQDASRVITAYRSQNSQEA